MSQELIKTIPVIQIEGLTPVQKGWVRLADLKAMISDKLLSSELEIQGLINPLDKETDLAKVQEAIRKARAISAESKDARLYFTNMVKEKVTEPMMEFERRNEDLLLKANERELALRKEANAKKMEESGKTSEIAALKAHIQNEHLRVGLEYRSRLNKMVSDAYTHALKVKHPVKEIKAYVKQVHNFMCAEKLSLFTKFERKYVSDAEAKEIYNAIPVYKSKTDLEEALTKLVSTFEMYENDLANSKKAIKAEEQRLAAEQEAEQERIEIESATNKLIAESDTYTLAQGDDAKTDVKQVYECVDENTDQWCFAVVAAFMGNMGAVKKYLRVRVWSKCTIGQMAAAIAKLHGETKKQFPDLKFKTIEK